MVVATRALEAELGAREEARPMSDAELDRLLDRGAGLERALRRAQIVGVPITEEAVVAWERARQAVDEHEQARVPGSALDGRDAV